ncbi:FK506-binding protein 2B [Jimgerdemannia flammicorona]|uniref:peptidylprolyl isomerase n=1 Tax=Jimgerdemannia flammicorona TaxID=994334 RepID=A0A433A6U5_9FUNG|nr:FK506-binding protein 2B [Jimgerdemannia flammicorona]
MKLTFFALAAALCLAFVADPADALKAPPETLQIGIKKRVPVEECTKMSRNGATLSMHYTGTIFDTGKKFDSSVDRGVPFEFKLGIGQVIKGWDQGLQKMCVGEKRRLVIPPDLAYGESGAGESIPPGATLVFEVELLDVKESADPVGKHPSRQQKKAGGIGAGGFDKEKAREILTSPLFLGSTALMIGALSIAYFAASSEDKKAKAKNDEVKEKEKDGVEGEAAGKEDKGKEEKGKEGEAKKKGKRPKKDE